MTRLYRFLGDADELARRMSATPTVCAPRGLDDVRAWIRDTKQRLEANGLIRATYVVDAGGKLRIADYGCEHVVCAGGGQVQAAGVLWLCPRPPAVEEVSNHSLGFCPEPDCWPAVQAALEAVGLPHPGELTTRLVFRRCPACAQKNVVKDGVFECGVCGGALPERWNL